MHGSTNSKIYLRYVMPKIIIKKEKRLEKHKNAFELIGFGQNITAN